MKTKEKYLCLTCGERRKKIVAGLYNLECVCCRHIETMPFMVMCPFCEGRLDIFQYDKSWRCNSCCHDSDDWYRRENVRYKWKEY